MGERDLVDRGVPAFEMLDLVKEFRIFPQRPGDSAKPADVLRVPPPRVVTPAIAVRDECGSHGGFDGTRQGENVGRYSTGRRRRSVMRKIEPFLAAVDDMGAFSSRISQPCSLTMNSSS